jgi:phage shock protein E
MLEWLDRFFDKHFLGSGTKSISPESEVAEAIRNGALVLDVRLAMEAKKAMVPGAKNIDILVLKRHLNELPRDRTIVTFCKTGGRAGKARDILDRNGFKVLNGGGYKTVLKIVENNESAPKEALTA